ncbi:MAG: hypothetical protein AAB538_00305 [Patescibacteria group bacterium]
MNNKSPQVPSFAAGAAWSLIGLLSGLALGVALDLPFRVIVFFAALGLAVGWFGFTGTYRRWNGGEQPGSSATLPEPPAVSEMKEKPAAPFRVEDHIFSSEQARQWLDDFLVKQQRK